MDAQSIWEGNEYLYIPERRRGETVQRYNFTCCFRVRVLHKIKAEYYGSKRKTTIVEIQFLNPFTGEVNNPHPKNVKARHIVARWEEVAAEYAEIADRRRTEQEERERQQAEYRERERIRMEEWQRRQDEQRIERERLEKERKERFEKTLAFLVKRGLNPNWIYSQTENIISIDVARVQQDMDREDTLYVLRDESS